MKVFIGKYPKSSSKEQKVNVRIDPWDTWNMDNTLAHIIVPMLKQLKDTQQGAPYVDMEDVPEELRSESSVDDVDDNHFKRWEYILNEMIFAFESKLNDWEEQFWKVKPEIDWNTPAETDELSIPGITPVVWKTEGVCDYEARDAYANRIQNGFKLFGKYYQGLWD